MNTYWIIFTIVLLFVICSKCKSTERIENFENDYQHKYDYISCLKQNKCEGCDSKYISKGLKTKIDKLVCGNKQIKHPTYKKSIFDYWKCLDTSKYSCGQVGNVSNPQSVDFDKGKYAIANESYAKDMFCKMKKRDIFGLDKPKIGFETLDDVNTPYVDIVDEHDMEVKHIVNNIDKKQIKIEEVEETDE
jgi:hypothetical protein